MSKRIKYRLVAIVVISIVLLIGLWALIGQRTMTRLWTTVDRIFWMRAPNSYEMFYHYAAATVDAPELCTKISPNAYLAAPWGGGGTQISLERTECYYDTAIRFARQDLCAQVKPISTILFNGSGFSPGQCRREIAKNGPDDSYGIELPAGKELVRIFSQMGYNPETIASEHLVYDPLKLYIAYASLSKKPDIINRVFRLLESPEVNHIPKNQREMLYNLAASVTNDISWCQKIRKDALYPNSKATYHYYFRDSCIEDVAFNKRDTSLCAAIPDRQPENWVNSVKRDCFLRTSHLKQYSKKPHYSYAIPDDDLEIEQLLKALKYPLPKLTPEQLVDLVQKYLGAFDTKRGDPHYKNAREDFIRRVKLLPDFK